VCECVYRLSTVYILEIAMRTFETISLEAVASVQIQIQIQ